MSRYVGPSLTAGLQEHPGHADQSVHGRRGGGSAAPPRVGAPATPKAVMKPAAGMAKPRLLAKPGMAKTPVKAKAVRQTAKAMRDEFRFLDRRLAAGGLKRGERQLIMKRQEALAKRIYGVPG